jgi:V/A-type H+-transporting ATPase subunit E
MDKKIQEITEKLYQEGVEKGNQEAKRLTDEAQNEATSIVSSAESKAQQIIAEATRQVAELRAHTEAELRLFASQAIEALKSEIADLISGRIAAENVQAATADAKFMQRLLLEIAQNWSQSEQATILTSDAKAVREYFASNAKSLLDKGLRIEQVNGKKVSFTIIPADGSYKLTFGEEEFTEFFKDFLRPQLVELLFR